MAVEIHSLVMMFATYLPPSQTYCQLYTLLTIHESVWVFNWNRICAEEAFSSLLSGHLNLQQSNSDHVVNMVNITN